MTNSNNTAGRSLPRLSAQGASFVTILVGPEKKPFVVHQELLTYNSTFFRAALTGSFKEAKDKTVTLQVEDPLIFEFVVHWLYHKGFPDKVHAPDELVQLWGQDDDRGRLKTGNLIKTYVFSEKYYVSTLGEFCLDELFSGKERGETDIASRDQINYAFDNLPTDSPMCRYLVDAHCKYANPVTWMNFEDEKHNLAFVGMVLHRYSEYALGAYKVSSRLDVFDYIEHPFP